MTYFSRALSEESLHSVIRILPRRSLQAKYVGVERLAGNCPDSRAEDSNPHRKKNNGHKVRNDQHGIQLVGTRGEKDRACR